MTSPLPHPAADHRPRWWQRLTRSGDDTRTAFPGISEFAAIEELLDLARASLQRCGFAPGEFDLQVIGSATAAHPPTLLVELDNIDALVWDFSSHLEAYLVDRVRRHGGFEVKRIVFTPKRRADLDIAETRSGVRIVWSALQARHGQQAAAGSGPGASHPNMTPAALTAD